MERRKFLTTASIAVVATTSGCLGYEIQKSRKIDERVATIERLKTDLDERNEEIEDLESDISDKEAQIQELKNKISEKEAEIEQAEGDITELENDKAKLESEVEDWKGKLILDLYSWGISLLNNGHDEWSTGSNFWNDSNYSEARAQFNLAYGYYDSAGHNFLGAEQRADEFGHTTVERYARDAKTRSDYRRDAAGNYQIASYYAVREDFDTAQDYKDDGDSNLTQAANYDVQPLSELESELGVTIDL